MTLVFTREFGMLKTILGFGKCLHFTNVFGSLYIIMYGSCGSQGSIVQSTVFFRRRGAFFGGNLRSNDACQTARRVLITISCATGIYISRHRRILYYNIIYTLFVVFSLSLSLSLAPPTNILDSAYLRDVKVLTDGKKWPVAENPFFGARS